MLFSHRLVDPVAAMTGIGRYVEELTKALASSLPSGWQLEVASTRETGTPDWLPPGVGQRTARGLRQPVHLAWTALHAPRIERLLGDFDLLHALQPSFPLPTRKPAVMTVNDVMILEHPEWFDRIQRWGFERSLHYAVDRGWHFVAISHYTAALAIERAGLPPERTTVIHLGIGDEFRTPVEPPRLQEVCARYGVQPGNYFLTVGHVSTRKNIPTLIRALAGLDPTAPPLLLAGRVHASGAPVIEEIERLGLQDRVRVAGFVPDADLHVLMQGALALAHPSMDEGFGFPPLEAMAAGVPVVAARAGSVPEIVGDAAVLLHPGDHDAWTAALATMAADVELQRRLQAEGRTRAAGFTWDRAAETTLAVYAKVLAD